MLLFRFFISQLQEMSSFVGSGLLPDSKHMARLNVNVSHVDLSLGDIYLIFIQLFILI